MKSSDTTRVNKFISHATGLSRREADAAVTAGRVTINGAKAAMGAQVSPSDVVKLDNKPLASQQHYTYVLFHKPVGYVCSRRKQGSSPTIYDLLPKNYRPLKTVGRLDRDSSGLLLLTDDGDFAHRMTHPSFKKQKTYEVSLDHALQPLHRQMVSDHGIQLEDGVSQLTLERLVEGDDTRWRVLMHEGRNRQIRRTFAALGYTVTRLHRTQFGPYILGKLLAGHPEKTSQK